MLKIWRPYYTPDKIKLSLKKCLLLTYLRWRKNSLAYELSSINIALLILSFFMLD